MNSIEAAAKVLADAGEPLHYKEISRRIIEQGLWETQGKTPERTVNANLGKDLQKHGENSRFQRTDTGIYALRSWKLPEYQADATSKTSDSGDDKKPTKFIKILMF